MSGKVFDSLSDEQKDHLAKLFTKVSKSYIEIMQPVAQQLVVFKTQVDEMMGKVAKKLVDLLIQYRTAIQEGITNFQDPELYNPDTVVIHPWTIGFALQWGSEISQDMKESHFEYLAQRYEEGFISYLEKDWQKAIFTFISCLDGVLREFCKLHREDDCNYNGSFPPHETTFTHIMNHYQYSVLSDENQFHNRLKAFFLHRHQIMHGDRYAFFDENIATISLLFLGLIFYAILSDLEE